MLVKAGHRDLLESDPNEATGIKAVLAFIRLIMVRMRESHYGFPAERNGELVVAFPQSLSWDTLSQSEFQPIANDVYAIIEEILGITIKELLKEAKETL